MSHAIIQGRLNEPTTAVDASVSTLPDNIQWMPPGKHTISPSVNGKPANFEIEVNEALAREFNAQLQAMRQAAAQGRGDEPYLDANHEDGEAMAHVTELYWGGDDPKTGGIRARVKWTDAGASAVKGRSYRRFSPQWQLDEDTGKPVGITSNLGGLVNRAAFRNIAPVMARAGMARGVPGCAADILMAQAHELAVRKNISEADALASICRSGSGLAMYNGEYRREVTKLKSPPASAFARAAVAAPTVPGQPWQFSHLRQVLPAAYALQSRGSASTTAQAAAASGLPVDVDYDGKCLYFDSLKHASEFAMLVEKYVKERLATYDVALAALVAANPQLLQESASQINKTTFTFPDK